MMRGIASSNSGISASTGEAEIHQQVGQVVDRRGRRRRGRRVGRFVMLLGAEETQEPRRPAADRQQQDRHQDNQQFLAR
jgi:hypothetical protein